MARTKGSDGKKTEAAIRERALELIVRHGFEALTMRQLASAVGIQAGALYRYFPGKQSLLFALMERHLTDTIAAMESLPNSADAEDGVRQFVRFHIVHHVTNRTSNHVVNNELRSLNRENFAAIMKLRAAYEKKLRTILKQGTASGKLATADTALTATAMLAMTNEICVWFRDGGALNLQQVADIYAQMAVQMVLAPGEPKSISA